MVHLTPIKNFPEAPNIVQSGKLFNPNKPIQKKSVLMARLKNDKSLIFLISAGRAFHSRGPATDKALSPNFVLVRRISYSVVIPERS